MCSGESPVGAAKRKQTDTMASCQPPVWYRVSCHVFCWWTRVQHNMQHMQGECLPGGRPARYIAINYPDFSPRFTL